MHGAIRAAACVLAFLPAIAFAGLFDDDEARAELRKLRAEHAARLDKLDRSEAAATRAQIELASQIEALRSDVAKLRGQIEVLTHELEQSQKRQKDFYVDLDARVRKLEQPPAEQKPADAPKPDPSVEPRAYEEALNLFKAAKYRESIYAFEAFAKEYPNSQFITSAWYWTAQAMYQLKDCKKATEVFHRVAVAWPNDPKAPDAMLGMAICHTELNMPKDARVTLEALIAKYPNSPAAQSARERLKRLKK